MSDTVQIPEGYTQEQLFIELRQQRSIVITQNGIVKINNNIMANNYNQTFSDIQVFASPNRDRFWIRAIMQKVYKMSDIHDMRKKSNYKLNNRDVVNMLGLNENDFDFANYSIIGKNGKTQFICEKKTERYYDCPNYVIIY